MSSKIAAHRFSSTKDYRSAKSKESQYIFFEVKRLIPVGTRVIPREARPKAKRSKVTNRVVFGLITWFASPGKSS